MQRLLITALAAFGLVPSLGSQQLAEPSDALVVVAESMDGDTLVVEVENQHDQAITAFVLEVVVTVDARTGNYSRLRYSEDGALGRSHDGVAPLNPLDRATLSIDLDVGDHRGERGAVATSATGVVLEGGFALGQADDILARRRHDLEAKDAVLGRQVSDVGLTSSELLEALADLMAWSRAQGEDPEVPLGRQRSFQMTAEMIASLSSRLESQPLEVRRSYLSFFELLEHEASTLRTHLP